MAFSFLLHPACHGSIPFFSAPFDDSQEAEGEERLALFSAFPKCIWSTAWGMWTLLLNRRFSHASSVSSANNEIFIVSLRIWGLGKCALLKGAVSSVGQCLGMLPEILLNSLLCALPEERFSSVPQFISLLVRISWAEREVAPKLSSVCSWFSKGVIVTLPPLSWYNTRLVLHRQFSLFST